MAAQTSVQIRAYALRYTFLLTIVLEGELWLTCTAKHVQDFLPLGLEATIVGHNIGFPLVTLFKMYVFPLNESAPSRLTPYISREGGHPRHTNMEPRAY